MTHDDADGISRRRFVQLSMATGATLSLPGNATASVAEFDAVVDTRVETAAEDDAQGEQVAYVTTGAVGTDAGEMVPVTVSEAAGASRASTTPSSSASSRAMGAAWARARPTTPTSRRWTRSSTGTATAS
jgi:hypothetical protein